MKICPKIDVGKEIWAEDKRLSMKNGNSKMKRKRHKFRKINLQKIKMAEVEGIWERNKKD